MADLPLPGYTVAVVVLVVAVLVLERHRWRTGLLRTPQYWWAVGITGGVGVLLDGVLTRAAAPLVNHDPATVTGLRWPGEIPVEDFAAGWGLVTLTLLVWVRLGRSRSAGAPARNPRESGRSPIR